MKLRYTIPMARICHAFQLGLVPFEEAWQLQNRLAGEIAAGSRPPVLLLLEHPHTYTFGSSGDIENLRWDGEELSRREIKIHWVDRGGDVTYHGPGQLVGYPLIPLNTVNMHVDQQSDSAHLPQADYIGYLRKLETTLIQTLAHLGVASDRIPGLTGVWIRAGTPPSIKYPIDQGEGYPAKIASIGVKVDARGISRHGFALNINPDMSYWEGIIGCGLQDYGATSLAELLESVPDTETIVKGVTTSFGDVFGYTMIREAL